MPWRREVEEIDGSSLPMAGLARLSVKVHLGTRPSGKRPEKWAPLCGALAQSVYVLAKMDTTRFEAPPTCLPKACSSYAPVKPADAHVRMICRSADWAIPEIEGGRHHGQSWTHGESYRLDCVIIYIVYPMACCVGRFSHFSCMWSCAACGSTSLSVIPCHLSLLPL